MPTGSELTMAIYRRDGDSVRRLLEDGIVPTFFEAAALGDAATVKRYIGEDPSLLRSFSPDGFAALHLAAFFGFADVVTQLLEAGADPNARALNATQVYPIHSAAASGSAETLEALLRAEVDVNRRQERGFTALHEAALNGNVRMIRALVAKGADQSVVADDGSTPLTLLAARLERS